MSSPQQSSLPRSHRLGRLATAIAGAFAGFLGLGWLIVWTLDTSEQPYPKVELDVTGYIRKKLAKHAHDKGPPLIVYLGDSLSMPKDGPPAPIELRTLLRRRGGRRTGTARVVNLSAAGLTAFSHYFASEQLAELNADRFIVAVNLGWFSRRTNAQQPSLAGMLPIERWPEAAGLPLHEIGLSADEIVTAHALMASGQFDTWWGLQREQVRMKAAVKRAGRQIHRALGVRPVDYAQVVARYRANRVYDGKHPTVDGAVRRWGPVLNGLPDDDPNLEVLDALVARLRESRARVLVMVPPTNVDVLEEYGMYDTDGFATSLDRIREVATRHDADFLDLHDLLPDDAFRDPNDHLDFRSETRPARRIAKELVAWSEGAEDWNRRERPAAEPVGTTPQ